MTLPDDNSREVLTDTVIDFSRLERAKSDWHFGHVISADDIPWLLDIAASVRYARFSAEDVTLLNHAANFLQGSLDLQGPDATWDFPQQEIDGKRQTIAAYRSLASRISALLPPSPS